MNKEIIIDYKFSFVRIAVIEEGRLTRLYTESLFNKSMQGRIIQGQITDIVKHLKAVFVDFGDDKKGLLHEKQIPCVYQGKIQQGMRLPVKVLKESVGDKGAKLTGLIDFKGEYSVCLPYEEGIGISKKIKDPQKKEELKAIAEEVGSGFGWIIRTEAKEVSPLKLKEEMEALKRRVSQFNQMGKSVSKGTLLYEEPFYLQVIKKHLKKETPMTFHCNEDEMSDSLQALIESMELEGEVKRYPVYTDLFKKLGYQKAYEQTLRRKVWLKNGGNLVIEQTEAMTVIDVNSAKAIHKKNRDRAIKELNELALKEALNQIYLRDLAGIILIDLVDFKERKFKDEFESFARRLVQEKADQTLQIYPITELHLLQLTRQKKRMSLPEKVYKPLEESTRGYKADYEVFKIEEEIQRIMENTIYKKVSIFVGKEIKFFVEKNKITKLFYQRYQIEVEFIQEEELTGFRIQYMS